MNYHNYPRISFEDVLDSKILVVDDEKTNVNMLYSKTQGSINAGCYSIGSTFPVSRS